ncbi:MAG: hypothetical protein GEU75_16335 [Dehalococcoidia bacterium]|nr:hypothetical protein [Dehalococcoidia bacterium]
MAMPADRPAGQINHCDWVICPGCGSEFRLANSYDFVGQIRRAGWGVDSSNGGWRCRDCRQADISGQRKLL